MVLFQHAHTFARTLRDSAVGRGELVAQDAHQRGFAGTVGADYTVAVARRKLHVHVLKQHFLTKLHSEIVNRYHILNLRINCT